MSYGDYGRRGSSPEPMQLNAIGLHNDMAVQQEIQSGSFSGRKASNITDQVKNTNLSSHLRGPSLGNAFFKMLLTAAFLTVLVGGGYILGQGMKDLLR